MDGTEMPMWYGKQNKKMKIVSFKVIQLNIGLALSGYFLFMDI